MPLVFDLIPVLRKRGINRQTANRAIADSAMSGQPMSDTSNPEFDYFKARIMHDKPHTRGRRRGVCSAPVPGFAKRPAAGWTYDYVSWPGGRRQAFRFNVDLGVDFLRNLLTHGKLDMIGRIIRD